MANGHAATLTVAAAQPHTITRQSSPSQSPPDGMLPMLPRWEGAPGFALAAEATQETLRLPPIASTTEGVDVISAADLAAFLALGALPAARPVYIGAEQLLALPPWSEEDPSQEIATALRYATDVRLAFDTLFLDFTTPGGEPCWIADGERSLSLYGAAMFRGQEDVAGALVGAGELAIVPFGSLRHQNGNTIPAWAVEQQHPLPSPAALGILVVGGQPATAELWLGESGYSGALSNKPAERIQTLATCIPAELAANARHDGQLTFDTPARVTAGSGASAAQLAATMPKLDIGAIALKDLPATFARPLAKARGESEMVLTLALRALRAVFLMDSTNVEFAPAAVSRQVRRAAERSDGERKIALTVRVRTRRSESGRRAPRKGGRTYSHSFERGGGYRHVTRGPQAKPEHLRPCPKQNDAHTQSGGLCRRYWVSSCVVDAGEGKPFVPKTRRIV
jgi:hypothetical protein